MAKTLSYEKLKKRPEYQAVAKSGLKWATPGIVVQFLPGRGNTPPKVGLTVSGRAGGAVDRSRIKRRLRQVIAEILPAAGKPGMTYVVIGRRAALKRSFEDLKKDLQTAISSLHSRQAERQGS